MTPHVSPVCPACGAEKAGIYWRRLDMELALCGACGLLFQTRESGARKNSALIDRIYSEYVSTFSRHLAFNEIRLEKIFRMLGREPKGLKILELGVGNGALGRLLLEKGSLYTGFEPYKTCREIIYSCAPGLKNLIIPEKFSLEALKGEKFDLVIANDALEHMSEPGQVLEGLKKALKPGGSLYLEVPDESFLRIKGRVRILFRMYEKGYLTNPDHVSLFTPATFRKFAERTGFKVELLERESVWGDPARIRIALGGKMPFYVLAGIYALKFTGLDLVLGGNITALLKDKNDPDTRLSRHPLRAESPLRPTPHNPDRRDSPLLRLHEERGLVSGCRGSGNNESPDYRGRQVSG